MNIEEITVQVIKHLDVRVGDVVIFSVPGRLSLLQRDRFESVMKDILPDGVKPLMLEDGMKCEGVLRMANSDCTVVAG